MVDQRVWWGAGAVAAGLGAALLTGVGVAAADATAEAGVSAPAATAAATKPGASRPAAHERIAGRSGSARGGSALTTGPARRTDRIVRQDPTPTPPPGAASNSSFVLETFGWAWRETPHRINQIGASIEGDDGVLALQGGTFADGTQKSDSADWTLGYGAVSSQDLLFVQGETPRLTLVGDPATAMTSVAVPRALLPGATSYAVFLRGFHLDTDITHTVGYTVRGLGAEVADLTVGADHLTFDAVLSIHAGAVPDRIQHLPGYRATGTIQYTVVGIVDGAPTPQSQTSAVCYGPGILNPARPRVTQTATIQGRPGFDLGFVALTGFHFRLNPKAWLFPGRYMRELSVSTSGFDYQSSTGTMNFGYEGYFSNSGLLSRSLVNDFDASFVLIQAADGSIQHSGIAGPMDGATKVVPLVSV